MSWFLKLQETFLEDNRYMWMVEGLGNTLIITFGALLIGVIIGTLIGSGPPLLPRAPSWAPWHSRPLLPGFTSATIPGTSVCHSVPDSCLSVSLPHSCPDPRECPFQKLPCPLQCPSLPPAQESTVTAATPLVTCRFRTFRLHFRGLR